jgi:hypothetical protein
MGVESRSECVARIPGIEFFPVVSRWRQLAESRRFFSE